MTRLAVLTAACACVLADAPAPAAAAGARPPALARVGNPPATVSAGSDIAVRWRAVNRTRRRAGRAVVTVRLRPAFGRSTLLTGRGTVPALRPRATRRGVARFTLPAVAPGEYTLVACAKRRGFRAVCRAAARRLNVTARADTGPGASPSPSPPSPTPSPTPTPTPEGGGTATPPSAQAPRLVAAGDIAGCDTGGDEQTAALLDSLAGDVVAPLGDLVYETGTSAEFTNCYGPSWGRHKSRTRPAVGNHEYQTPGASGYFGYFGTAAGDPSQGYYSYDLGSWHVIVLNSNCSVVACDASSPQAQWLREDLAAHPAACTLAYWHHPRFSSSQVGPALAMTPLWSILDDAGADVALTSHAHNYERFAPQTASGTASAGGIRQWVVGTGGRSHHALTTPRVANSERSTTGTFGVLELTLRPDGYDWRFVPVAGGDFSDTGSASCV